MRSLKLMTAGLLLVGLTVTIANLVPIEAQQTEELPPDLVAYWPFDEGEGEIAFDQTANENVGTLKCMGEDCELPQWVERKIGTALRFDGDDFVEVQNSVSIGDFGNNELTIVAWIQIDQFPASGVSTVVGKWANRISGDCYTLSITSDNKLVFAVGNGSSAQTSGTIGDTKLETGKWYHVAGVHSDGEWTVYLNADSDGTGKQQGEAGINNGDIPLRIASQSPDFRHFIGMVDEVRLYNKALTQEAIRVLYTQAI